MTSRSLLLLPLILVTGCMSMRDATVTLTHTPSSIAEAPFALRAGSFTRTPPEGVAPNQYETTGYTFERQISLAEPLADYLRTAFFQEARRAGASLRDEPACTINASLDAMGLRSNGWTRLDWSGTVTYQVTAPGAEPLSVTATAAEQTNTDSAEAGHSKFITGLVDGLLKDSRFAQYARSHCPRRSAG